MKIRLGALGRNHVLLPTQLEMEFVMQLPALQSLANDTLQLAGGLSLANIEWYPTVQFPAAVLA